MGRLTLLKEMSGAPLSTAQVLGEVMGALRPGSGQPDTTAGPTQGAHIVAAGRPPAAQSTAPFSAMGSLFKDVVTRCGICVLIPSKIQTVRRESIVQGVSVLVDYD